MSIGEQEKLINDLKKELRTKNSLVKVKNEEIIKEQKRFKDL